jgi:xanthine dehydrogenase accessory factor
VVVATQGIKDMPSLTLALGLQASHVAFIASRRKGDALKASLREAGADAAAVAAIEAPAGLPIHAETPPEIALSILASLVSRIRSRELERDASKTTTTTQGAK